MNCIGIDPAYAKPIGWAWRQDEEKPCWQVGDYHSSELLHLLCTLTRAQQEGCTHAVIEGGYIGKNPKVGMRLESIRGQLRLLAQQAGLEPIEVAPATWQTALLSQGKWRPTVHADIVRMARWRVESLHGLKGLTEDQCVAVLLAEWGNAQLGALELNRR